ncbi:MAG TPA: lactate utilization protein [Alphaproteobacteria bacterium]|jgi:L-lactate dehydrogenase complex protein LldG|nr:lactate utilization protein [Alphaproteobacteria bacterium]
MSARDEILRQIRAGLKRGALGAEAQRALAARLAAPPQTIVPARARGNETELFARFCEMAKRAGATVSACEDTGELGREIARFLGQESLPRVIRMAPEAGLDFIALLKQTGFSILRGAAEPSDRVGLSRALAGAAETGSLMLASGEGHPMSLAFLPEVHIAVLPRIRIVGCYEEAMAQFRSGGMTHALPRAVTFVTGPSRSADIEQKIQFGAHGPRRLHICVLEKMP